MLLSLLLVPVDFHILGGWIIRPIASEPPDLLAPPGHKARVGPQSIWRLFPDHLPLFQVGILEVRTGFTGGMDFLRSLSRFVADLLQNKRGTHPGIELMVATTAADVSSEQGTAPASICILDRAVASAEPTVPIFAHDFLPGPCILYAD